MKKEVARLEKEGQRSGLNKETRLSSRLTWVLRSGSAVAQLVP
jgi:hypothetical protein